MRTKKELRTEKILNILFVILLVLYAIGLAVEGYFLFSGR